MVSGSGLTSRLCHKIGPAVKLGLCSSLLRGVGVQNSGVVSSEPVLQAVQAEHRFLGADTTGCLPSGNTG